ncbi:hypothetical protein SAMN05421504_101317 [Amycolatopsis xylanica]|uniref:Uncharacterized protein n=1 Tax=Amycolatopsis xylanica TaxID=589385 RepID=A0A1H2SRH5_9PSEU|nr:hypothetical protein [Amycolatopsis xylanica]SDW34263.1 hypothetical protein SAMN05421504_101317 [Amycolatopsis xylanica]
MTKIVKQALMIAAAVSLLGAPLASAVETRDFRGDGDSSFGPEFALMYARWDAQGKSDAAGFTDCYEAEKHVWAYSAWVIRRCTR